MESKGTNDLRNYPKDPGSPWIWRSLAIPGPSYSQSITSAVGLQAYAPLTGTQLPWRPE